MLPAFIQNTSVTISVLQFKTQHIIKYYKNKSCELAVLHSTYQVRGNSLKR